MKRVRIKMLLALTVALLMTFAISGMAEAGGMFGPVGGPAAIFPYIIKDDPNVTTVISLFVPSGESDNNADAAELHYVYITKATGAAQTASCTEYDFKGATSPNDLVTFDVSEEIFGDAAGEEGLPLFNDTTSAPLVVGSTLGLTVPGPVEGFLLVEVLDENNEAPTSATLQAPDGEALILDIANGGAWGYRAYNAYADHDEQALLRDNDAVGTIVYPTSVATTTFVVTPLSAGVVGTSGGYASAGLLDMTATIQPISNTTGQARIYDRNEQTLSSTIEKTVTCVHEVELADILSAGILNNAAFIASGGWAYLWNTDSAEDGTDAFVYKVESSSALGGYMINGMPNGGDSFTLVP